MADRTPWRLFVAVEVPHDVRDAVAEAVRVLRASRPAAELEGLRWTDPGTWHLTVAFLGAVDPGKVPAVEAVLADVAARTPPFELALSGLAGRFGAAVLWAGLDPSTALEQLVGDVRAGLGPLRLAAVEAELARPYHPHLTLARQGGRGGRRIGRTRGGRLAALAMAYTGPRSSFAVDRVVLVRSHLGAGGARHAVVAAAELGGEG